MTILTWLGLAPKLQTSIQDDAAGCIDAYLKTPGASIKANKNGHPILPALSLEAGKSLGLEPYIREQILSVIGGNDALIDRFLEGSRTHALRRSHELEAVVAMLTAQQVEPVMSRATLTSLENLIEQNQKH